ncbi:hypothetical protein N4G69_22205 [Streptomyces mirabilis]|uniref:hypothetical protein n=1 Tax=Streptomyces mirabilis TaxID=68239 RepID=UPI0021C00345|nr:hypothetical protein [Streptomyces mirabilis]MCT9108312.1 hypothetical protein [Streptomyces mirabilis]
MTTRDHINSGMSDENMARVLRSRADAWNYSAELESAAKLAANGEHLSPQIRTSLGFYAAGKMAAAASGRDVSGPANSTGADRISAAYDNLKGNS